jgi:hypothetical protein
MQNFECATLNVCRLNFCLVASRNTVSSPQHIQVVASSFPWLPVDQRGSRVVLSCHLVLCVCMPSISSKAGFKLGLTCF